MDRLTDKQANGWQTESDKQMNEQRNRYRRIDMQTDGQTDRWV